MKENVEDTLMDFLQTRLEAFSITSLLEYLGESVNANSIEELASFLAFNQLAYMNPTIEGEDDYWVTRAGLFTGKTTVITPTKSEIISGILIPGSRLIPFCDPVLLPHELTFKHKGQIIARVVLECSPDEVYPHYQLFGDEYTPQYLSLDNEENTALFNAADYEDPLLISVSVFDMRDLYWSVEFKAGDSVLARVEDWAAGIFEIGFLSSARVDTGKQLLWMKTLEQCLLQSFNIAGPGASMDEQLSFAFFLGMDVLFTPYASSIEEFLRWSTLVSIEPYGVESRLWFTDQGIPAQSNWTMTLVSAPTSMLEEAFMHLSLPLSAHIMDSYIYDALFNKEKSPDHMIARMIPPRMKNSAFCTPVIERAAHVRYKQLSAGYNWFADHDMGTLRNRCIALHNALMCFIFSLQQTGIIPEQIPDQGAVILGQLLSHTIAALENIDFSVQNDSLDFDSLWVSIEGMEDSFFEIKTAIQDVLPELNKRRFSVIKKEPPNERF